MATILDPQFWIFQFWPLYLDSAPQKTPIVKILFDLNKIEFWPPYWIHHFEFCDFGLGFGLSAPKNPYRQNSVWFAKNWNFGRHIGSAILNFAILTSDSDSASQKTPIVKILFDLQKIKILAAILDPPFWILQFWSRIRIQRPKKPL